MESGVFNFSKHLQDSILILGIEDDEIARYLASFVKPDYFLSDISKFICKLIAEFYSTYQHAPREHFADILEEKLKSGKVPESQIPLVIEYVQKIYELTPSKDFVLANLSKFIRYTNIIQGIIKGAKLVEQDKCEEAEKLLLAAFRSGIQKADIGINYLQDLENRASPVNSILRTEIHPLDEALEGGFSRQELVVWLSSTNVGKSWSMIHCAKVALLQGLIVLYYTLEMTAQWVATRLDMGITAMGTKERTLLLPPDNFPYIVKSIFENTDVVKEKIDFLRSAGGNIFIKGMPPGGLVLSRLREDLEMLAVVHGITPDVVIIDYADLMSPETSYTEYRHDLAAIYRGLREVALERNCVMITASQSNRASIGAHIVSLKHFAEDIQKANIADIVLSLCQTEAEERESKMRIFCCKNRSGIKGFQIENYYSYKIGQFSLFSRFYEPNANQVEE